MARIHPDKGYFEVATHEQQLQALRELWSGKHAVYNASTRTCPVCKGKGYTRATSTKIVRTSAGLKTVELGSGCPTCYGVGKLQGK